MTRVFALSVLFTGLSLVLIACVSNSTEPMQETQTAVSTLAPAPHSAPVTPIIRELSLETLKNTYYESELGSFQLVDGIHHLTPLPDESPEDWYVKLDQPICSGDVNGDGIGDAVVTLKSRSGGTGVVRCLAVVVNQQGRAVNVATRCLGDRERITGLRVEDGFIVADVVTHRPNDSACCPTLETTWRYQLVGNELLKDE